MSFKTSGTSSPMPPSPLLSLLALALSSTIASFWSCLSTTCSSAMLVTLGMDGLSESPSLLFPPLLKVSPHWLTPTLPDLPESLPIELLHPDFPKPLPFFCSAPYPLQLVPAPLSSIRSFNTLKDSGDSGLVLATWTPTNLLL